MTPENFQQVLLEQAGSKVVIVDFYVQGMPECQVQHDAIAATLANAPDAVIWTRVDCQHQQGIAMQFGVQALPTIALIKEGQPIDGLAGPQPAEAIAELLNKHMPKPEDDLHNQVQLMLASGQFAQAAPLIKQALELAPERVDIQKTNADVLLNLGRVAEAEAILAAVKMIDQDDYYHSLMAQLELKKQAADTPEIQALQTQLDSEPDNIEVKIKLAVQLHQVQRSEEALTLLFDTLKKQLDAQDGEAKRIFMDILQAMPTGDEVAAKFRRKLYGLMY
nr:tetratricopeptide repeat protein [Marinifaba aquimaris]